MNNPSERVVRREFEKRYKDYNLLDRKENGEYEDWNLELTWRCWSTAWACAEVYRAKKAVDDLQYAGFVHAPDCPCDECAERRN
jgi:hypothetical protein